MEILYESSVTRTTEHREDWAPTELFCPSCGQQRVWQSRSQPDDGSQSVCLACGVDFAVTVEIATTARDKARLATLRAAAPGNSEAAPAPVPSSATADIDSNQYIPFSSRHDLTPYEFVDRHGQRFRITDTATLEVFVNQRWILSNPTNRTPLAALAKEVLRLAVQIERAKWMIDQRTARLAKFDALLESEEPPEELLKASRPVYNPFNPVRSTVHAAWCWFREQFARRPASPTSPPKYESILSDVLAQMATDPASEIADEMREPNLLARIPIATLRDAADRIRAGEWETELPFRPQPQTPKGES